MRNQFFAFFVLALSTVAWSQTKGQTPPCNCPPAPAVRRTAPAARPTVVPPAPVTTFSPEQFDRLMERLTPQPPAPAPQIIVPPVVAQQTSPETAALLGVVVASMNRQNQPPPVALAPQVVTQTVDLSPLIRIQEQQLALQKRAFRWQRVGVIANVAGAAGTWATFGVGLANNRELSGLNGQVAQSNILLNQMGSRLSQPTQNFNFSAVANPLMNGINSTITGASASPTQTQTASPSSSAAGGVGNGGTGGQGGIGQGGSSSAAGGTGASIPTDAIRIVNNPVANGGDIGPIKLDNSNQNKAEGGEAKTGPVVVKAEGGDVKGSGNSEAKTGPVTVKQNQDAKLDNGNSIEVKNGNDIKNVASANQSQDQNQKAIADADANAKAAAAAKADADAKNNTRVENQPVIDTTVSMEGPKIVDTINVPAPKEEPYKDDHHNGDDHGGKH